VASKTAIQYAATFQTKIGKLILFYCQVIVMVNFLAWYFVFILDRHVLSSCSGSTPTVWAFVTQ